MSHRGFSLNIYSFTPAPTQTVPFCHNHMYRGLTYPKLLGGLPHCGIVVDDIVGDAYGTLFNIVFQKKSPQSAFLQFM